MRICILSNYSGFPDEGTKNTAVHLCSELEKSNEVLHVNARSSIVSMEFWKELREFDPQIIHIFLRPNILTLTLAKAISLYRRNARVIISAMQPPLRYQLMKRLIPLLRPDLVLVQTDVTARQFADLNCQTMFLPVGVDIDKFTSVPPETRSTLKKKYGIRDEQFVILHVGSMRRNRNLKILADLQKQEGVQVVVVANTTFEPHDDISSHLEANGCLVWRKYIANLEEIYGMADCYVFPVHEESGSVEFPLSVIEAMSCNLPVISTRFGALPEVFHQDQGLVFLQSDTDVDNELRKIRHITEVRNREKVMPYSWDKIGTKLEDIYRDIVS